VLLLGSGWELGAGSRSGAAIVPVIEQELFFDTLCTAFVEYFKGRPKKKKKKKRESRSVVFAWDCVFLAYFVKTCCTSF
jgi:hypothetical protein